MTSAPRIGTVHVSIRDTRGTTQAAPWHRAPRSDSLGRRSLTHGMTPTGERSMAAHAPRSLTRRDALIAGLAAAGTLAFGRNLHAADSPESSPYRPFRMAL